MMNNFTQFRIRYKNKMEEDYKDRMKAEIDKEKNDDAIRDI